MRLRAESILIVVLVIACSGLLAMLVGGVAWSYARHRAWTEKALFVQIENDAMLCQFEGDYSIHVFNSDSGKLEQQFPAAGTAGMDIAEMGTTPNAVIGSFTSLYGKPPSGYFLVRVRQRSLHTFATLEELRQFMSEQKIPQAEIKGPLEWF